MEGYVLDYFLNGTSCQAIGGDSRKLLVPYIYHRDMRVVSIFLYNFQ